MVVHIVMIKLKDEYNSVETQLEVKRRIDSLMGSVPSLLSLESGVNFAREARAMDFVLTAKFKDENGLEEYAKDPTHLKVIAFIKSVAEYTKVVDYIDS